MAGARDLSYLSDKLDPDKVSSIITRTSDNGDYVNSLVNDIVTQYCKPLDDLVKTFRSILDDPNFPPTDEELDQMTLKLPTTLYFAGEGQESLGIKEDVAKAVKQEVYSKIHSDTAGTIADKEAKANVASQYESLVNAIYARAYKQVKGKVEAGYELLQSIKKVISRRCLEAELTGVSEGRTYRRIDSRVTPLEDKGEL